MKRFHGNEQLVNGPRFHMLVEADQSLYYIAKLEIRGVQATDKGEYRAVATNKHGESVATINLNFDSSAGGAPKWESLIFKFENWKLEILIFISFKF